MADSDSRPEDNKRICPSADCGFENPPDAQFCRQCGTALPSASPSPNPGDAEQPKSVGQALREAVQPFIDLAHAPRALWGINVAYVLEGMVYFGMLGYLAIYFSDFVFQSVDHADEASHNMVMVLTAGITIAMFFLGTIADKKGVRFALIAAFSFMVGGRCLMSGGPNLFGLQPVRPGVFAGDKVSLYVKRIDDREGTKAITNAVLLDDKPGDEAAVAGFADDLAAGEGTKPDASFEARFVSLSRAHLLKGEAPEFDVEYGQAPVKSKLLIHTAEELGLHSGATISLRRAYVFARPAEEDETKDEDKADKPAGDKAATTQSHDGGEDPSSAKPGEDDEEKHEYVIRSHWLEDVVAIDTFPFDLAAAEGTAPDASYDKWAVRLSKATVVDGAKDKWNIKYGASAVPARLLIDSRRKPPFCPGATFTLNRATVRKDKTEAGETEYVLHTEWPGDFTAIDTSACADSEAANKRIADELASDLSVGDGVAPDADLEDKTVQISKAEVVEGEEHEWQIRYGAKQVTATLIFSGTDQPLIGPGALISLSNAYVEREGERGGTYVIHAEWPEDVTAVNTFGCEKSPYRHAVSRREEMLRSDKRAPIPADVSAPADAQTVSLAELRDTKDGRVNVVLRDVDVTYARNGGYCLQADPEGPALFRVVAPFWSPLHIVTLIGMILVVIGYGMYQPAAYAGVRQFTTPKTAGMGFAMLYALMNLGGWLPTFAFLLRDDDFLGLGIPGTYWVYTGFTVLALFLTITILSRKTVHDAIERAKAETEAIKAAEAAEKEADGGEDKKEEADNTEGTPSGEVAPAHVKPHMWLFWVGAMVLFIFKGEAPWYYTWEAASWRWILAALIFVSPTIFVVYRPALDWLRKHPLGDGKFAFFIFALIPVQTLFTYNWLILPQYISRAFSGWIGNYFEIMANANPLLIFIAVPIIAALTQRAKVYNMMIIGTFVMAAPAFLLAAGPHPWALVGYLLFMTIGEAMWQPRFLQYAAEIAPHGRTGEYMGVAQLPWFLTKVLVPLLYSGWMMDKYCPAEGEQNTQFMWFVFACIAMVSSILLVLAKPWIGKDFKTKAD